MKKFLLSLSIPFLLCLCKEPPTLTTPDKAGEQVCRIMFWNSENLFDCYNDSTKLDDEFLPHGLRGWTTSRYKQKINSMYKVFIAAGDWNPPDLIGLCEIENKNVLFDLIHTTQFSYYNYRFIHHESPDRRGIDVALLYNPARIEVINEKAIPVDLSAESGSKTRDILYARVNISNGDTLSVFVNHWPSKYGGAGITADLREAVAEILAQNILEIQQINQSEKIIAMGDFNDPPESASLLALCNVTDLSGNIEKPLLVNLGNEYYSKIPGSYKYEGAWELIDQFLISESLISGEDGACVKTGSFRVFSPAFLLENDEKYGGMKPFRTYSGVVYQGGYSDHLPVLLDLYGRP